MKTHTPTPAYLLLLKATAPHAIEIGLCSLMINFCGLLMPLFSMLIYDKVVGNGNLETLWTLAGGMMLALLLEFTLRMIRSYVVERLGSLTEVQQDQRWIDRLLHTPSQHVASPGVLMSRYRDLANARDALLSQYAVIAADLPFLLCFLLAQGLVGGWLVLVPMIFAIPILLGQWLLAYPQRDYGLRVMACAGQKASLLSDMVSSLSFLQMSVLQDALVGRWNASVAESAIARARNRYWQTSAQVWAGLWIGLASVTLLVAGIYRIEAGAISVGVLIACALIQLRTMVQFSSVVSLVIGWKDFLRLQAELNAAADVSVELPLATANVDQALQSVGTVSVLQVSTLRDNDEKILDQLSLIIAPGERVALVGRPGSGKSTLLRCIAGIQPLSEGQILFDGLAVDTIPQEPRRRLVTYKPQEPRLFGPTLQDDLQAMSGLRGTQALLLTGLQKAFHQGELRRDQRIDAAHGAQLSGGQKQILALASSLAQDTSLYLLDEPTAGVDAETEAALVHAIDTMTKNRSMVLATHSPALLKIVDRIILLERGKLLTSGTPTQLLGLESSPSGQPH